MTTPDPGPETGHSSKQQWNRDDDQKPGAPPRAATEPEGSEGSARGDKTMTDPASGEPNKTPPAPNRSDASQDQGREVER